MRLRNWTFFKRILLHHFLHFTVLLVGWSKTRKTPTHIKSTHKSKPLSQNQARNNSHNKALKISDSNFELFVFPQSCFTQNHTRNSTNHFLSLFLTDSLENSAHSSRWFSSAVEEKDRDQHAGVADQPIEETDVV